MKSILFATALVAAVEASWGNQGYAGAGYGARGYGAGYGAQAGYGKAGYGRNVYAAKVGKNDYAAAYAGPGYRGSAYGKEVDKNASKSQSAALKGYDDDAWAQQAYGTDTDGRWGKSYDNVDAKSYDMEEYARKVQADDDQWAEDYDQWMDKDTRGYGNAASAGHSVSPSSQGYYGYAPVKGHVGHGWGNGGYAGAQGGAYGGAYGGYGGYGKSFSTPAVTKNAGASKAYGAGYNGSAGSDWDAWGRDQDLRVSESYDQVHAKSYNAESYDEWDNADDDKWGAQSWGRDQDKYGASSWKGNQSKQNEGKPKAASTEFDAEKAAYDNDSWAKQAYGSDYDSRWGKSYDNVGAKSYNAKHYSKEMWADDDQWAEDKDKYTHGDAYSKNYGASKASQSKGKGWGKGPQAYNGASASKNGQYWGKASSDWDSWGRDQDYGMDMSYDDTQAKSYQAESYDEWDNSDSDKWGAQAWGRDQDVYGSSSLKKAASKAPTASESDKAAKSGYDNDSWAKQAYGVDSDSRWGKSYDAVGAKSYRNRNYAEKVRADDDQWAEDYDTFEKDDVDGYGQGASAAGKNGQGKGWGKQGAAYDGASAAYGKTYDEKHSSDWDAWGRDQDYLHSMSYGATDAKSYEAESYDEWDNADDDKWGAQAWGVDQDKYGASSKWDGASKEVTKETVHYGTKAADKKAYGKAHAAGYGQWNAPGVNYGSGHGSGYGWNAPGYNYGSAYGATGKGYGQQGHGDNTYVVHNKQAAGNDDTYIYSNQGAGKQAYGQQAGYGQARGAQSFGYKGNALW